MVLMVLMALPIISLKNSWQWKKWTWVFSVLLLLFVMWLYYKLVVQCPVHFAVTLLHCNCRSAIVQLHHCNYCCAIISVQLLQGFFADQNAVSLAIIVGAWKSVFIWKGLFSQYWVTCIEGTTDLKENNCRKYTMMWPLWFILHHQFQSI